MTECAVSSSALDREWHSGDPVGTQRGPSNPDWSRAGDGAEAALGRWDEAWEAVLRVEAWAAKVTGGQVPNPQRLLESHRWDGTQSFV